MRDNKNTIPETPMQSPVLDGACICNDARAPCTPLHLDAFSLFRKGVCKVRSWQQGRRAFSEPVVKCEKATPLALARCHGRGESLADGLLRESCG